MTRNFLKAVTRNPDIAAGSHPFFFSFRSLSLSSYLGAATRLALRVAKEKNMEKVERLIRTWVATQQEAQVTETVAGKLVPPLDPSTIQAKIIKRYPEAKSRY